MELGSERILPEGFAKGPLQGQGIIGEVTESLHRFLMDGWTEDRPMPRIEEDLSFVPKDREEVIYVYMYSCTQNTALRNGKHYRASRITVSNPGADDVIYYERPPLYLDLRYMICVHSRFRSVLASLCMFLVCFGALRRGMCGQCRFVHESFFVLHPQYERWRG